MGSGGYTDPDNPAYMYAETQLFECGLETKTLQEIIEYIRNVKASGLRYGNKYVSHELVPSFFMDEWQEDKACAKGLEKACNALKLIEQ